MNCPSRNRHLWESNNLGLAHRTSWKHQGKLYQKPFLVLDLKRKQDLDLSNKCMITLNLLGLISVFALIWIVGTRYNALLYINNPLDLPKKPNKMMNSQRL